MQFSGFFMGAAVAGATAIGMQNIVSNVEAKIPCLKDPDTAKVSIWLQESYEHPVYGEAFQAADFEKGNLYVSTEGKNIYVPSFCYIEETVNGPVLWLEPGQENAFMNIDTEAIALRVQVRESFVREPK